jgi:hypothetical protein
MVKVILELDYNELDKLQQMLKHDKSSLSFKVHEKLRHRKRREMLEAEFGGMF